MITIISSSKNPSKDFEKELINSSGLNNIQFLSYENKGTNSLTEIYNKGLKESKYNIVVFSHDDISIETKQWGKKLLKLFNKNPEYGILGVAGTKNLPEDGKWWSNPRKMYGRVAHTHEGKTWLSTYSDDLNQSIEETVIVDGVFFAIDKTKIKKYFNEDFKGFHFYDLSFCFENYLENVKIGVTTLIRINHKSIGATNDEWEKNRIQFSETFKDKLPVNIKKVLRKGEQLKVLMTSLSFDDKTLKSKIMFDIAKRLKKNGHNVTLCSNMNGTLPMTAKQSGLGLAPIQQPPGFLLGDGKWSMKSPNGDIPSQQNVLYKMKDYNFDIIHTFDNELIEHMIKLYPTCNLINTVFSNGLYVDNEKNSLCKNTIELLNDLDEVKKIDINNVIEEYTKVI